MTSITLSENASMSSQFTGLRPVNLRTDLGELADLIEMAFADSMDNSGRAAIREMRSLSRTGIGRNLLFSLNELTEGINLGFVWIQDGRLVGNVSIYPANLPAGAPKSWIIANVAVHPDYRGRGIANKLLYASLDAIRSRSQGQRPNAILQVVDPNLVALHLYEKMGFVKERHFTYWRRPSSARMPTPLAQDIYITQRRSGEWRAEMALAARVRPAKEGGVGWLRPMVEGLFRRSLWQQIIDLMNLRSIERLIVRDDKVKQIRASMWIEAGFATSSTHVTLMIDPEYSALYGEALLNLVARRYSGRTSLTIEHPTDDEVITALLQRYHFSPQRTLVHMHWQP